MTSIPVVDLYTKFYGMQDDHISRLNQVNISKFAGTIVDIRVIAVKRGYNSITFSTSDDAINKLGYSNMRIIGCDAALINKIELTMGYGCIDSIYPKLVNRIDCFPIIDADNIIPALKYHQYGIIIDCDHECEIVFDVIKLNESFSPDKDYGQVYMSTQFSGTIHVYKDNPKVQIYHNHPVHKIEVFADKPISNVRLNLDNIIVHLNKINDQNYEYNFSPSTNFSKINQAFMLCDFDNDYISVSIFSHASNIMRYQSGMCAPTYSN